MESGRAGRSGEYEIGASAPGYDGWTTKIEVEARDKKVEVPVLDKSKKSPKEGDDAEPHAKPRPTRAPDADERADPGAEPG